LIVLLSLLLPLIFLEAVLRLFGPILPGNYDTGAYLVRDEALGHFHVPGFDGWIKAPEFTTRVTINPQGLRDLRQSFEKPDGTFRVLLLGDSFVEAVQVQQAQGVAEQLERALNQGASRPVEVINGGVAAYGTGQEMLLLDQVGAKYQPDLIVLLFFVGNDVTNNNYRLELWGDKDSEKLALALKPYWDLNKDGTLRMIPGPPPAPRTGLSNTMRRCCMLYNVIETGVFNKLNQNYPREQLEAVGGLRTPLTGLYDTQPDGDWEQAWKISEALLVQIRDRAKAMGAPLVVAGGPEWRALEPDAWYEEISRGNPNSNRLKSGRLQITAPTDQLGGILNRIGVPYINLLPPLETAFKQNPRLYYDFDKHWTAAGHAVAAQAISQALHDRELTAPAEASRGSTARP
jgi:lysophospholipase L1-like esterase